MQLKSKPTRGANAFTLVEMLVVIVIIAALAALTFVTVGKIRSSAFAANSSSNIRQLYVGNQMYLSEYQQFPTDSSWGSSDIHAENMVHCTHWGQRIAPFIGMGTDLEETQELFIRGELPPGIFQVPGRERLLEGDGGFMTGYARNPQINQNSMRVKETPANTFKTLVPFPRPFSTYFLIDTGGESTVADYNGWEISKAARLRWPAHGGKPNSLTGNVIVCYMDGSVASLKKGALPSNHRDIFWSAPIDR